MSDFVFVTFVVWLLIFVLLADDYMNHRRKKK